MKWQDRAAELRFDLDKGWDEVAATLSTEYNQQFKAENVRGILRRHPRYKKDIVFVDRKEEPTQANITHFYNALKNMDQAFSKLDTKQTKMTIDIPDNKPVGICFWGDWHIGAHGCDYEQFDRDLDLIRDTDGLYFIGMGDYKDNQNALVHASGVNEQTATQGMQDMLVKMFMEQVGHKALALVRGCHDDWDHRNANKDFISTLCAKDVADCVNLWHGGGITVKLQEQTYKIRARHKYKNESGLNTTNSQRNMLNDFGPCDVICIAHKHFPDMQMLSRMKQKVVYFRSGTYKVYDEYGQKLAGYTGEHGVPMVVLYPDRKQYVPFENLQEGIVHLRAVRK